MGSIRVTRSGRHALIWMDDGLRGEKGISARCLGKLTPGAGANEEVEIGVDASGSSAFDVS